MIYLDALHWFQDKVPWEGVDVFSLSIDASLQFPLSDVLIFGAVRIFDDDKATFGGCLLKGQKL